MWDLCSQLEDIYFETEPRNESRLHTMDAIVLVVPLEKTNAKNASAERITVYPGPDLGEDRWTLAPEGRI